LSRFLSANINLNGLNYYPGRNFSQNKYNGVAQRVNPIFFMQPYGFPGVCVTSTAAGADFISQKNLTAPPSDM
jgi:hypothetical protein